MSTLDKETDQSLLSQLVRLGDMIGDGLDREPGGAWIRREYRRIAKALGHIPPKPRRKNTPEMTTEINDRMAERCAEERCPHCKLERTTLKQARSGSMSAKCTICDRSYKLLRRAKK
ncbi:MAG: cysteine-rich KTR [Bacteriophage sp.]|nr:MAG: cysteine-rich KTR [Bacteriophage sp.]